VTNDHVSSYIVTHLILLSYVRMVFVLVKRNDDVTQTLHTHKQMVRNDPAPLLYLSVRCVVLFSARLLVGSSVDSTVG
jgi:hypothetical protein